MYKKSKTTLHFLLTAVILFTSLASAGGVLAQEGSDPVEITAVDPLVNCGEVQFTIQWSGVSESYMFVMDFGDGDTSDIIPVEGSSLTISHTYPDQGYYKWTVRIGTGDKENTMTGLLSLEGPEVFLSSSPFPPLFVLGDAGTVDFTADVTGGTPPFDYSWDLDGDGSFESETVDTVVLVDERSSTYTAVDKYYPQVLVKDACTFTSSDTMPVVVADPEDVCHPTAQKIADGVNTIFPDQAGDLYTCEDVYGIFDNETEENNLGFGIMWKAYHLAESMDELSWEDILDWKLNESNWGALIQLDRFADLLEEHNLPELMVLVLSRDFSLGDVRAAVRSTTRYEADFEDALARIAEGANPGELGQFYKLANDLEADPAELDIYLADGLTLAELKHTAKFADQIEVDWTEIADARSSADSWGDLKQAYNLATDEVSATEILILGVQEYKKSLQEKAEIEREDKQAAQSERKTQQTAARLVDQFSAELVYVMSLFEGDCDGNWACVRKALREQEQEEGFSDKDIQTALQIEAKYGFDDIVVLAYHEDFCEEDWACTRAFYREQYKSTKLKGKPEK